MFYFYFQEVQFYLEDNSKSRSGKILLWHNVQSKTLVTSLMCLLNSACCRGQISKVRTERKVYFYCLVGLFYFF